MNEKELNLSTERENIVYLGEARFPFGFAATQRMTLIGRAILRTGSKATVICRKGSWDANQHQDFSYQGNFEGIDYIYTSKSVHKPKGFIKRNLQKLKGVYGEFRYLKHLRQNDTISLAIVSNRKIIHVLRYYIFSRYLGFPIAINLVEMASAMAHRSSFTEKINNYLFDNWVLRLFDGALPISDKLMTFYQSKFPDKSAVKIPIICDFDKFNIEKKQTQEPYFLYCGSVDYEQVRDFVIHAYKGIANKNGYKLFMIISSEEQSRVKGLQEKLQKEFNTTDIKVFSNIPYQDLVSLYVNAKALLIPLRDTLQDTSRFPHKIGEYLASGNPVITTNVGEIQNYFTDEETALVTNTYNIGEFSEKMQYVVANPKNAIAIGLKGKELGLANFDYKILGEKIKMFSNSLNVH
jgi:glycosyltransferase involved in cell wall biosynthesis